MINKKKFVAGIIAIGMLATMAGCTKGDKVPETPGEVPVETPTETPVETPDETPTENPEEKQVYEGKFWEPMTSMSQTELEASDGIYFYNTAADEIDGKFNVTASKIYFEEEGLFVELYLHNGTDLAKTNLILEEFNLAENAKYEENAEATTIPLIERHKVGAFKNIVVLPDETKTISFVVPYDALKNEVYNLSEVTYSWTFKHKDSETYSLESSIAEEAPAETETPVETPEG